MQEVKNRLCSLDQIAVNGIGKHSFFALLPVVSRTRFGRMVIWHAVLVGEPTGHIANSGH